jgi:hypothetical protein
VRLSKKIDSTGEIVVIDQTTDPNNASGSSPPTTKGGSHLKRENVVTVTFSNDPAAEPPTHENPHAYLAEAQVAYDSVSSHPNAKEDDIGSVLAAFNDLAKREIEDGISFESVLAAAIRLAQEAMENRVALATMMALAAQKRVN